MRHEPMLWGRGSSSNVQKVLWTAHELGIEVGRRDVGGPFGGTDTSEFRALNPNGTVPVWQEDGFVLWESHAIMRHLARRSGRLYGSTEGETARVDQWLDWHALVFWPPIRFLFLDVFRAGKNPAEVDGAVEAIARVHTNLDILARALSEEDRGEGAPSIALISFAIGLNRLRGLEYDVDIPAEVVGWHERVKARPGFGIATRDEPEMPGHRAGAPARDGGRRDGGSGQC